MAPAATMTAGDTFNRKDRVVAAVDLPGIPAGTKGKVTFVEGFSWVRYWVRFDNGVVRGSINRKHLARPQDWERILERRAQGLSDDDAGPAAAAGGASGDATGGEDTAAGAVVNGVSIPAFLLERSQNRRTALSA
jgi:hypothetical protein